jgi:hypothetical protein
MKILVFFLPLFFISDTQDVQRIYNAFGDGDVEYITSLMDDQVEISIQNHTKAKNKQKASGLLEKFYQSKDPIQCKLLHKSKSRGDKTFYSIGFLKTSSGNYRIYLYLQNNSGTLNIKELRIDNP